MTNNKYYLVRIDTDGTVGLFKTKKTPELQQLYDLIGCDLVESVRIDNDVLMLVDESGWLKEDPVPNFKASLLYSDMPHSIAGNAVLLKLDRRACDWKAFTFDEAVAVHIEIEARAKAYIQDKLM
jgi:hypothetical protein